jgi:hypothetical protein
LTGTGVGDGLAALGSSVDMCEVPSRYCDTARSWPIEQGVCVSEDRQRYIMWGYLWAYVRRRRYYLALVTVLGAAAAMLLGISSALPKYGKNLSLNLGTDLIGTIVVLFLIAPFIERAELRRDSVLERFDHRAFIRQAAVARHRMLRKSATPRDP